jgi:hypothetical protein
MNKPPTLDKIIMAVEQAHWEAMQRAMAIEDEEASYDSDPQETDALIDIPLATEAIQ